MSDIYSLLFTATEAGPLLGIAPATITKWHQRGKIVSAGKRGNAHLYLCGAT